MKSERSPRVLFLDIETAPLLGYTWRNYDTSVLDVQRDWHILSFAAKWANKREVVQEDVRKSPLNDIDLMDCLWELLHSADIVVAHNGAEFDLKKINARFAAYDIPPPSSYRVIDTLKLAKKKFAFTSNSLDFLAKTLRTRKRKLKHGRYPGFELWKQCLDGNISAFDELARYNKQDVLVLEEVYRKLRAWDTSTNLYIMRECALCSCGGRYWANGWRYTNAAKYRRYRCTRCGHEMRGKSNELKLSKEVLM